MLFLGTIWLSVLTTPLFELFCYYRVYLFAKTQSRLMLNAAGYLQASLLVFLVCFALSAYLAISIYRNPGFEKTKQLIMSLAVNVTCGAVTLIEAPKLVWPLANSMVLDATVPAFMLLFLFNMAGGIFGLMSFRKLRQIR